jgi:DNA-binding FrmR family transcriptional regulator
MSKFQPVEQTRDEYVDPIEEIKGEVTGLKTMLEKQQRNAYVKELTGQNREVGSRRVRFRRQA